MSEFQILRRFKAATLRSHASSLAILALGSMAVSPAYGQENSDQSEAADDADDSGVIIVSAARRDQDLQDVAQSITALSGDQLQQLGVSDLSDLTESIAGVELFDNSGAGLPTWVIRGVGLTDFNANNTPTAAVFYDENYLVSNALNALGTFDIQRIEVLKGPPGGLYGRNTTGGAVRIISNKPELDITSGSVTASYGSWDRIGVQAALNVPLLADKIGLRLAVSTDQGGGWQDTLATPQDDNYGDRDFLAARGQLLFQLSDTTTALFKIDIGRDKSETPLGRSVGALNATGFCAAIRAGRRDDATCIGSHNLLGNPLLASQQDDTGRTVIANPINRLDNDWIGVNIQFERELSFADFKSISTYLKFTYDQTIDSDGSPLILLHDTETTDIEQWSQEFRLVSNGSGPVQWLFGAAYARDTVDNINVGNVVDNARIVDTFEGADGFSSNFTQVTRSIALYGQAGYDISDSLNVNASVRFTDEDKELRNYNAALTFGDSPFLLQTNQFRRTSLRNKWSGHVGLDWRPVDDVLVYAKYARGFKSGGFFGGAAVNADEINPYREEAVNAYEIGVKSRPIDDLTLNASAFFYDYIDAQGYASIFSALTRGTVTQLANLGDAEHIGVEAEFSWTPAAIPGFSLQGSATYLDAEITSSTLSSLNDDLTPSPFLGLQRENAPKYSFFVNARQEIDLSDNLVGAVQANYSWRAASFPRESFTSDLQFGLSRQDAFGVLGARASVGHPDGNWELAVSGENLTNEDYVLSATTNGFKDYQDIPALPVRFKVEATVKF